MWKNILERLFSASANAASKNVISAVGSVDIVRGDGQVQHEILAQMDTARELSSIDRKLAKELGLYSADKVVDRRYNPDSSSSLLAEVVEISFLLSGEEKRSLWFIEDRSDEKLLVVIGKTDLSGFLVQV